MKLIHTKKVHSKMIIDKEDESLRPSVLSIIIIIKI